MRPVEPRRRARRHVHLGERIRVVERIRAGRSTVPEASLALGVSEGRIRDWVRAHAGDRTVYCDEIRDELAGEAGGLSRRAALLARLLAEAERTVRHLHGELVRRARASTRFPNAATTTRKDR